MDIFKRVFVSCPQQKKNNLKFLPSVSSFLIKGKQRQKTKDFITINMSYIVVQLLSHVHDVQPFATPWTAARQSPLSSNISWSLLKFMCMESVMLSNYLILCYPLLLLPLIFPSIKVFSNESVLCIRWPKYWSFNISTSNEYSELISSRISWDFPGKNTAVGCFTSFSRGSFWPRNSWPMSPALPMDSLPMIHQGNPISIIGNVIGNP